MQPQKIRMSRSYEAAVTVSAGLVGFAFGAMSHAFYVFPPKWLPVPGQLGPLFGSLGGLMAGVAWSRWMRPRFESGDYGAALFGPGLVMGGAVGAGSTLFLHAGIQFCLGLFIPTYFGLAFTVGLPAGAFVGALCAMVGAAIAGRARRKATEPPRT